MLIGSLSSESYCSNLTKFKIDHVKKNVNNFEMIVLDLIRSTFSLKDLKNLFHKECVKMLKRIWLLWSDMINDYFENFRPILNDVSPSSKLIQTMILN